MTGQGKKDGYNNEEIISSRLNADIDKGFVGYYMDVPSIRDHLFPIINIYQNMLFIGNVYRSMPVIIQKRVYDQAV